MNLDKIKTLEELKLIKAKFYSKDGEIKQLQLLLKKADVEEKAKIGKNIQALKQEAENSFAKKSEEIIKLKIQEKIENEWIDINEPLEKEGSVHPLSLISRRVIFWLEKFGYSRAYGSEIETDEYNFERLNISKNHPARDMQDSLYINPEKLLRTHNTGISARELEKNKNKEISTYSIGAVYRNDEDDATHSHQFTQCDIVAVGNYSFPNLIWTIKNLLSFVFEQEVEIRMRPSYFPFTEPSVEVDIFFNNKWVEVLGAGMIHKDVLKKAGYSNDMNGIAAGVGIERLAMIKYGVEDIREFYTNNVLFLDQFKGDL